MKKFIFLIFVLMFNFMIASAETVDNEGPVLNSFSFAGSKVKAGKDLHLNIDLQDEVAGSNKVVVRFVNPNNSKEFSISYDVVDGKNNVKGKVPLTTPSGEYTLWYIYTYDKNNNKACYHGYKLFLDEANCQSIEPINITVEEQNYEVPNIINYNIFVNEYDSHTFEIEFDKPEIIKSAKIVYYSVPGWISIYNNNNKFKGNHKFEVPGSYNMHYLEIITNEDVIIAYYVKETSKDHTCHVGIEFFEPDKTTIVIEGEVDQEAPLIESIEFSSTEIKTPGYIDVKIKTKDNISNNIKTVNLEYGEYKDEYHRNGGTTIACSGSDDLYNCRIELNQYSKIGKYIVYGIRLLDKYGNYTIYMPSVNIIDDITKPNGLIQHYESLEDYIFYTTADLETDTTTSNTSNNLLDKIENASDDAKISIDSTNDSIVDKKVFKAIMNTNKTIYIEKNGVVWIFNGKDITKPKDIDTEVNCYLQEFVFYKEDEESIKNEYITDQEILGTEKALIINFKANGVLPGKAKIRIKADYTFRNYIGIENLNLYYKQSEGYDIISSNINITKDGYYEFYIDHNSTYILTSKKVNNNYIKNNLEEKLNNDKLNQEIQDSFNKNKEEILENYKPEQNIEEDKIDIKDDVDNHKNWYIILPFLVISIILIILIIFIINLKSKKKNIKKQ